MSAVSRYYFVFLMGYFLLLGFRGLGGVLPQNSYRAAVWLLIVFAFPILAFNEAYFSFNPGTLAFGAACLAFVMLGSFLMRRVFKQVCPILESCMFFLLAIGLVMLYRLSPGLAMRQLIFAAMGFGMALLVPMVLRVFREFERLEIVYLLLSIGMLGIVVTADVLANTLGLDIPIVAVDQFGATRWLVIGGINFQPSEFVKFIFVLYLACAFRKPLSFTKLVFVGAASGCVILILVAQRDLGHALVFFMVFMVMLYAARGSIMLFGLGLMAMSAASVVAYQYFPHLRVRVAAWRSPWADISNTGFQIAQSLFAIGSWGAFGAGLGLGLPNRIPVVERDMIFAAISEEFGWIFGLGVIAVYGLMLARGMQLALRAKRPMYAMMALGYSVIIGFQAFVGIGGNIGLIPLTGITLPLMSYGGSSVFVTMIMFGTLQWLAGQEAEFNADEDNELR